MEVAIETEPEEIPLRTLERENPEHEVHAEESNKSKKRCHHIALEALVGNIVPDSEKDDYIANCDCWPPPVVIPILTAAQVAVFIYYAVKLTEEGHQVTGTTGLDYASPIIYRPSKRHEAWRFVTYMFIHQGWVHISMNSLMQLLFGLPLEMLHESWRVLIVYLMGVISGSLAHSLTDHSAGLVGASGGGYALIGAHIAAIITNWQEMNNKCYKGTCLRTVLSAPVKLALILFLVSLEFGVAIYRRFSENDDQKIGIAAHIGGLLAGLFLGLKVLKNLNVLKWESILQWIALAIFLIFIVLAILFNIFYKGYPETQWD